jgi:hypothetical protein
MKLSDLHVLHLKGTAAGFCPGERAMVLEQGIAWVISTCQRTVVAVAGNAARDNLQRRCPVLAEAQCLNGPEAYAFLLRFACGLESRMLGETEIFGQVKEAWKLFSANPGLQSRQLDGIVQMMFQDVKDIRAQQLSGLGSSSYGSQVRRLLGEPTPGPTLLVGAGQLGQAVAPWIPVDGGADGALLIWNRSPAKAHELAALVRERYPDRRVEVLEGEAAELEAWERAGDVIVCVPVDAARDAQRIARRAAGAAARGGREGRIVHLGLGEQGLGEQGPDGRHTAGNAAWSDVPGLTSLVALFDMLRAQDEQRRTQVLRARRACAEKAVLRSLGNSATQPHGWEDLAAFATLAP